MVAAEIKPGTVIGREFEVVAPLAHGGMGAVYLATQRGTGARRALKVMHGSLVQDEALQRRFEQEARVGAGIASDHVVQVVAAGVDEITGMPWIAMELLEGMDLAQYLRARGALSIPEAGEVVAQLCHALAAAHAAGVVHRDLKLENVFLAATRTLGRSLMVKVLDFGLAKVISEARAATKALGTPLCMAPEQAYGRPAVSPATDVWALGLLVFELLVGRSFWMAGGERGAAPAMILREVVVDPIPAASERAATFLAADRLPAGFDAWFARCVAREQEARFADAGAAWAALAPLLGAVAPEPAALLAPAATNPREIPSLARTTALPVIGTPARLTPVTRLTYRERFGKTVVDATRGATILEVSKSQGVSHANECGGRARCTTCRVVVLAGEQNLTPRTDAEAAVAARKKWPDNVRLACQARVLGDVSVRRLVVDAEDLDLVAAEGTTATTLQEREVVVMAATLRNLGAFAAQNLPLDVAHVLQRAYRQLVEPITLNHGKIHRFDDGTLVAVFDGAGRGLGAACMDAARAALRMQMRIKAFNQYLARQHAHAFDLGIGLHCGAVLAGVMGKGEAPVTVLTGEVLDLALRIEPLARALRVNIAVTEAVCRLIEAEVSLGRSLPGLSDTAGETLDVFELKELARPDAVFLVQSTFEQLAPRADAFARSFYARLFERCPEVEPLFDHVDMDVQRGMLMKVIATAVRGLEDLTPLVPTLQDLGRRHVRYGVKTVHYRAVGEALLWALGQAFGEEFTPEVETSWREVYGLLARTMIEAAREVQAPANATLAYGHRHAHAG